MKVQTVKLAVAAWAALSFAGSALASNVVDFYATKGMGDLTGTELMERVKAYNPEVLGYGENAVNFTDKVIEYITKSRSCWLEFDFGTENGVTYFQPKYRVSLNLETSPPTVAGELKLDLRC